MRVCVVTVLLFASAAPAAAQSTYVGGSLLFELARFGGVNVEADDPQIVSSIEDVDRNGESMGFDVRVGRALGERWGVEFAFARGGEIEDRFSRQLSTRLPEFPIVLQPNVPPFGFEYEIVSEQQHTTLDALAWIRQDVGDRVDLALSAGVSFARVQFEQTFRFTDTRLVQVIGFPREIETVEYGAGPVVGAEAIIAAGEHLAVTAGLRLHATTLSAADGWLIRPAMGLRWRF